MKKKMKIVACAGKVLLKCQEKKKAAEEELKITTHKKVIAERRAQFEVEFRVSPQSPKTPGILVEEPIYKGNGTGCAIWYVSVFDQKMAEQLQADLFAKTLSAEID